MVRRRDGAKIQESHTSTWAFDPKGQLGQGAYIRLQQAGVEPLVVQVAMSLVTCPS